MTAPSGAGSSFKSFLFENLALKLISIICALGIYAVVHGEEVGERTINVPLIIVPPPKEANRVLVTKIPNEVTLTLRGPRGQLEDLRRDNLSSLKVDLSNGREARVVLTPEQLVQAGPLGPRRYAVPEGLNLVSVAPEELMLDWDNVTSRVVPVKVPKSGDLPKGAAIKQMTIEPPSVDVRGPTTVIETIQFVHAAPFEVGGRLPGSYRQPLVLEQPPTLVEYHPNRVTVSVDIGQDVVTKSFPRLRIEAIGAARAIAIQPAFVAVTISGAAEDIASITADTVIPRVEPRGANIDLSVSGTAYLDVLVDVKKAKAEVDPPKVLLRW